MSKVLSLSLCKSANEIFFHLQSILKSFPLQSWPNENCNKYFSLLIRKIWLYFLPEFPVTYIQLNYSKISHIISSISQNLLMFMDGKKPFLDFRDSFWISCALIIKTYNLFHASVLKVLKWYANTIHDFNIATTTSLHTSYSD